MKSLYMSGQLDEMLRLKLLPELIAAENTSEPGKRRDSKIGEPASAVVDGCAVEEQVEVASPSGHPNRAAVLTDGSKTKIQSRGFSESGLIDVDPESKDSSASNLEFLQPSTTAGSLGRLQQFEILRVIGHGGMGIVLEGFDTLLQRSVAIKVLSPRSHADVLARQRFCRESRAMASLVHDHVVGIYQVTPTNEGNLPFFVMPLIRGESLDKRLAREGRLPVAEVLRIGMQVASGLTTAHWQNLIHRDIKPGNILLEEPFGRVKLTDFGLARSIDDLTLTQSGTITGTPKYMSPEQALGLPTDERSDLFSLGAVLFEAATGGPPFLSATLMGLLRKITDAPLATLWKLRPDLPESAALLIDQMLAKRPEHRPVSMAAVRDSLALILSSVDSQSPNDPALRASNITRDAIETMVNQSAPYAYRRQRAIFRIAYCLLGLLIGAALTLLVIKRGFIQQPTAFGPAVKDADDAGQLSPKLVIEPVSILSGNAGPVRAIDFTPEGETLAMAIDDGTVKLWDVATKRVRSTIKAHPGPVWGMSISRDGKRLATGGDDDKIRIFDLSNNEELVTLPTNFAIRTLTFSHAGYDLLVGGRTGQVEVWDAKSGQRKITTLGHSGTVAGVAFSHDDRTMASVSTDKTACLWDAKTGSKQLELEGHSGGIYSVAFSTDGSRIVTGGWDQTVRMWDTASGTLHHTCEGHNGDVWAVSYCESTHLAASVGEDRVVRVWHGDQANVVAILAGHTGTLYAVTFSRDGRLLATAGRDGTARLWDVQKITRTASRSLVLPGD